MTHIPVPPDSYLSKLELLGIRGNQKVWRNEKSTRYYTWDGLHGEIEVFNKRGKHIGVLNATTGVSIKEAVKGRKIDV